MAYLDILLFAFVALFVGYRLWTVLGTHDPAKPIKKKTTLEGEEVGYVVRSQTQGKRSKSKTLTDDGFDEDAFLGGAQIAFKRILEAYAGGDKEALSSLLNPDMLARFSGAIDARQKKGDRLDITLYRIIMSRVIDRKKEGTIQKIKVKFISEQCVLIHGKNGELLEGDPSSVEEITDIWTFERDERSSSPNWTLIEAETE